MCLRSILCAEQYYLSPDTGSITTADRVNFKKFVYQLALSQLFIIQGSGVATSENNTLPAQLFLLEDNGPIEWVPRFIIQLDDVETNVPCHLAINVTTQENIPFVHSTLYLLHAYKYYVVNDYKCRHYNQWLVLDANNEPVCTWKHGKSHDTESNYKIIIVILTSITIMMVVMWVISFMVNTPKLIQKIDETNRLRLVK